MVAPGRGRGSGVPSPSPSQRHLLSFTFCFCCHGFCILGESDVEPARNQPGGREAARAGVLAVLSFLQ